MGSISGGSDGTVRLVEGVSSLGLPPRLSGSMDSREESASSSDMRDQLGIARSLRDKRDEPDGVRCFFKGV